jgi:hypothetical protein
MKLVSDDGTTRKSLNRHCGLVIETEIGMCSAYEEEDAN